MVVKQHSSKVQRTSWCVLGDVKLQQTASGVVHLKFNQGQENKKWIRLREVTTVPAKTFAANVTEKDPVVVYTFSLM